jgi:VIT1/CCC1 family predicted Fe2+/Mn2+ transporter
MPWARRRIALERRVRAREFVFGIQDGLISTVGLLSGMSVATDDRGIVILTGVAAAVTGGLSMATGSYLASTTERRVFEKELVDQKELAASEPWLAREALLESLVDDGLDRPAAYRVVQTLATREDLLVRTVQEKVLGLGTADLSQPLRAGLVMFLSFAIGAMIPLGPFLLPIGAPALAVSWVLSVATLLGVGIFTGVLTGRPPLRAGLEFAAVALGAALAGWLLGHAFERLAPLF